MMSIIPFASGWARFGLTQLSVWWLRFGIRLERIVPGHPEQNGRHERMHRTLKQEATRPAAFGARDDPRTFRLSSLGIRICGSCDTYRFGPDSELEAADQLVFGEYVVRLGGVVLDR
jgi:hypothetical protein